MGTLYIAYPSVTIYRNAVCKILVALLSVAPFAPFVIVQHVDVIIIQIRII